MIIECPSCRSKYQYDEQRFDQKPSKKIRCARCQEIFVIHNPAFAKVAATGETGDSTFSRADAPPPPAAPAGNDSARRQSVRMHAPQLPSGKRLSLAILDGPDAGSVFRIEKPRVTIGRSNADLTLNDTEASRQHAAVEIRGTTYLLSDLGSTNGTICNGEKIGEPIELSDKAEFVVGTTTLMLIVTEEH